MTNHIFLGLSVFIACTVEMVEALVIVLALGIDRGWKSAFIGTVAALLSLGLIVAAFGPILMTISDDSNPALQHLWLVMGALMLIFGVQWVRKALLRIGGVMSIKDRNKVYEATREEARSVKISKNTSIDWYTFVLTYKAVLLEGIEVIFIVITFGVSQQNLSLGIWAALSAFVAVCAIGLALHKPLTKVPETMLKLLVGVVLIAFGTYFGVKGLGINWPHGESAIFGVLAFYSILCYVLIDLIKSGQRASGGRVG